MRGGDLVVCFQVGNGASHFDDFHIAAGRNSKPAGGGIEHVLGVGRQLGMSFELAICQIAVESGCRMVPLRLKIACRHDSLPYGGCGGRARHCLAEQVLMIDILHGAMKIYAVKNRPRDALLIVGYLMRQAGARLRRPVVAARAWLAVATSVNCAG